MNCKHIIDAYAWIEYFKASNYGDIAKTYIESDDAITPTIAVAEVSQKLQTEIELGNETQEGRLKRLEFMRATSRIEDLDFEIAVEAGKTNAIMKKKTKGWGMADSIILCTAKSVEGKVVTGDEHFKGLNETIFIKQQTDNALKQKE